MEISLQFMVYAILNDGWHGLLCDRHFVLPVFHYLVSVEKVPDMKDLI